MRGPARRWWAALVGAVLSLPAWPSALVVLVMPPVAGWLPTAVVGLLWPAASVVFAAIARLPPGSLAGQLFYGSFAPLPGLVGEAALAVHAALLGFPWLALGAVAARRAARAGEASAPRRRAHIFTRWRRRATRHPLAPSGPTASLRESTPSNSRTP